MDWDDAACTELGWELFFVIEDAEDDEDVTEQVDLARSICEVCPVRVACLETALSVPYQADFGIWGGTTRAERWRMRRLRTNENPEE